LVNKFIYGVKNPFTGETWIPYKEPQRSDIVVFKYPVNPKQDFIKRVIGVEGDRIKIVNKQLFVNGQLLNIAGAVHLDPNIIPGNINPRDNMAEISVPKNSLFVMGDNRDNSHDSRFWKFVKLKNVKGKAFILYWSWDKENFSVRIKRLFKLIH
jgi:signal peptidase I